MRIRRINGPGTGKKVTMKMTAAVNRETATGNVTSMDKINFYILDELTRSQALFDIEYMIPGAYI